MLKRIAVLVLLAFAPLAVAGCAGTGTSQALAPGVTQAQADLHKAEQVFNAALKTIATLQRAGVLAGEKNEAVKKGVKAAHAAIVTARAAVDAKSPDVTALVLDAVTKVLEVVASYKE